MNDIVIGLCLSVAFAVGGFIHEFTWRRHLAGSKLVTGKIIGESLGRNGMRPNVAYTFRGAERRFVSKYGGHKIIVGEDVSVAYNPSSGIAEIVSNSNRWVWTIVPAGLSVVIFVGTLIQFS